MDGVLQSRSHIVYSIPFEVWRLIFLGVQQYPETPNESVTPLYLHLPGHELDRQDVAFVRTLKAIRLVAPFWKDVATDMLFRRAELRDVARLVRLVEILHESREKNNDPSSHYLGWWITTIWLEFHIPKSWKNIYTKYVSRLVTLCPNLSTFNLIPVVSAWNDEAPESPIPSEIMRSLADSPCNKALRNVTFSGGQGPRVDDVVHLLGSCPNMNTLNMTGIWSEPEAVSWPLIRHENLRALRFYKLSWPPSIDFVRGALPPLPSLTYCSFISCNAAPREMERFWEAYGHQLTSIFWHPGHMDGRYLETSILPCCPNVTDVAYGYGNIEPSNSPYSSRSFPSIQTVWIYQFRGNLINNRPEIETRHLKTVFPNIKSIYIPDVTIRDQLASWPRYTRGSWLPYVKCLQALSIRFMDANGDLITTNIFERHVKLEPRIRGDAYEMESSSELDSSDTDYEYCDSEQERMDDGEVLAERRRRPDMRWVDEDEEVDSDFARQVEFSDGVNFQAQ
jgi:hypothetical protein